MRIVFHLATGEQDIVDYAPLGFAYMAAFLAEHDVDAKCSIEQNLETIASIGPDVIGISCSSQNYGVAIQRAQWLRERCKALFVLGGVHISCLPESLHPAFDIGVMGEGEDTFHHLLRLLDEYGSLPPDKLDDVPGIIFFRDGQPVINRERESLEDLDMLPWPDRALLPAFKYAHVMTGRGCPFDCRFCTSRRMWGGYRGFSAARIAEEIEMLVAEEHEHIHIHDDLFADRAERVIMVADALEDRDLLGAVELSCAVRADRVTPDLCEALVRLGATSVTFGMESADDATQERLGKGYGLQTIRRALRLLERYEIEARVSGIVGEPDESLESMRATFRFVVEQAVRGRLTGAEINVLTPLPGTPYWDMAVERGLVGPLENFDWAKLGAPWHGLLLNQNLPAQAARLIGWDRHMRLLFHHAQRPMIILTRDDVELDLDLDPTLVRAVFLLAEEPGTAEVLEQGVIDVVRLGPDQVRKELAEIAERYAHVPLLAIVPDPAAARLAVLRACKQGFTLTDRHAVHSRKGPFPFVTVLADTVAWENGRLERLLDSDEAALPEEMFIADPQAARRLPAEDFNMPVTLPYEAVEALDRYAAALAKLRR